MRKTRKEVCKMNVVDLSLGSLFKTHASVVDKF